MRGPTRDVSMNDTFDGLSIVIELLLPLLVIIVLLILKAAFIMKRQLADSEHSGVSFGLEPEARSNMFLRHLESSPQLAYLRRQRRWIGGYIFCSWLLLVLFIIGLGGGREELNSYWNVGCCAWLAVIFADISVQQKGLEPRFVRTRPLTLCFLFWSSTGVALTSLLAAIATAALGLFLMLRLSYGLPSGQELSLAPDAARQASILISTLQASPLRPVLPLLTTTTLVFSLVVAVFSLFWRLATNSGSKFAPFVQFVLYALFFWLVSSLTPRLYSQFGRFLFQYNNVGLPASYACALIPIVIATALLRFGQLCYARKEIP